MLAKGKLLHLKRIKDLQPMHASLSNFPSLHYFAAIIYLENHEPNLRASKSHPI